MSHSFAIHRIEHVHADRHDYDGAPLNLSFHIQGNRLPTSVTLFLHDDALTTALVKAINDKVAEHAERRATASAETEAA